MAMTAEVVGMESLLDRLKERLKRFMKQGEGVNVGILEGSKWPDNGQLIAPVAASHEFGGGNLPPRPFLRNTLEANKGDWAEYLAENLRNGMEVPQALGMMGEAAAMDVQATLESGQGLAPLKYETVMEKTKLGFTEHAEKPLVRTGELMKAIGYEVITEGSGTGHKYPPEEKKARGAAKKKREKKLERARRRTR